MHDLTESGSPVPSMMPRKRSENTGEDIIQDEKRDGYVIDRIGKIRGEVRNYDPYSRFGEIMLYEIDEFGFVPGYISIKWSVMSEEDISVNRKLSKRLRQAKYQAWKRSNIDYLLKEYNNVYRNADNFEMFCSEKYRKREGNKE